MKRSRSRSGTFDNLEQIVELKLGPKEESYIYSLVGVGAGPDKILEEGIKILDKKIQELDNLKKKAKKIHKDLDTIQKKRKMK